MSERSTVAIVGSGPAALSAGLWLKNIGLQPVVLECNEMAGGSLRLNTLQNNWVLGQQDVTGTELAKRFLRHVRESGIEIRTGVRIRDIAEATDGGFSLKFQGEVAETLACDCLLLATGMRFRGIEVLSDMAGAKDCTDKIYCGPRAFADLANLVGKKIAIVGGGDNAFENAAMLLDRGAEVLMLLRSGIRARRQMQSAVIGRSGCEILSSVVLRRLHRQDEQIELLLLGDGLEQRQRVDRIHILAGYQPNTDFVDEVFSPALAARIVRDAGGYLQTDSAGRTSCPRIFAAGDVCNPLFPSVISALAQGAQAAKAIGALLESSFDGGTDDGSNFIRSPAES